MSRSHYHHTILVAVLAPLKQASFPIHTSIPTDGIEDNICIGKGERKKIADMHCMNESRQSRKRDKEDGKVDAVSCLPT